MRGQLWQECRRRGCDGEPVCIDCECCERHCSCEEESAAATERQELNALESDRAAEPGEWEAYRASSRCPTNQEEAIQSIRDQIAQGIQTRDGYDQRRKEFESELYTMHATGQFDVLRAMELEKVVNVLREFLDLCPFDGANAFTTRLAQHMADGAREH